MFSSVGFSTPRGPFAGAAPLAHRPLSAIAATIAGGVPQSRIQRIIAELIPVLEALHQTGRICGDISVHSVGLDECGRAHLMALASDKSPAERLQGLTPGYAPFELYTESPDWPRGPWTDIYALSAVAYSLVAGQRPPPATERCVADTHQPLMTLGLSKYSDSFLQAIDAGLAMAPAERPQSMQAYAELLDLPVVPAQAEPVAEVAPILPAMAERDFRGATRKPSRRTVARAVLLAIVSFGVAIYWWGRLASGPNPVITHSELAMSGTGKDRLSSSVANSTPAASLPPTPESQPEPAAESGNQAPEATQETSDLASAPQPPAEEQEGDNEEASATSTEPSEQAKAERKATVSTAPVRVSINVRPWGEIVIDGVSRGVTPPLKTVMLRPGKYAVRIINTAQPPYNTTLVVTAGKPAVITHLFR